MPFGTPAATQVRHQNARVNVERWLTVAGFAAVLKALELGYL